MADRRALTEALGAILSDIRRLGESGAAPAVAAAWPSLREVPDLDAVFAVDGRPVLTAWAQMNARAERPAGLLARFDDGLAWQPPPRFPTRAWALAGGALAALALAAGVLLPLAGAALFPPVPQCTIDPASLAIYQEASREAERQDALEGELARLEEERGRRRLACPLPVAPPPPPPAPPSAAPRHRHRRPRRSVRHGGRNRRAPARHPALRCRHAIRRRRGDADPALPGADPWAGHARLQYAAGGGHDRGALPRAGGRLHPRHGPLRRADRLRLAAAARGLRGGGGGDRALREHALAIPPELPGALMSAGRFRPGTARLAPPRGLRRAPAAGCHADERDDADPRPPPAGGFAASAAGSLAGGMACGAGGGDRRRAWRGACGGAGGAGGRGEELAWYAPGSRSRVFSALPVADRRALTEALGAILSDIRRLGESGAAPAVAAAWPSLREVPDLDAVFAVDGRPVLTAWAQMNARAERPAGLLARFDDGLAWQPPPRFPTRAWALAGGALAALALAAGVLLPLAGAALFPPVPQCTIDPASLAIYQEASREAERQDALEGELARLEEERGRRRLACPLPVAPPPPPPAPPSAAPRHRHRRHSAANCRRSAGTAATSPCWRAAGAIPPR
ncbi:hypothetical protein ACFQU2_39020 [Siccirubricoccus deserti]